MRRPLLTLFLAFTTGVVISRAFNPHPVLVWAGLLLGVAALLVLQRREHSLTVKSGWPLIALLVMLLAILRYQWGEAGDLAKTGRVMEYASGQAVRIEAVVVSDIQNRNDDRVRFTVDHCRIGWEGQWTPLPVRCLVEGRDVDSSEINFGQRVRLKGYLSPIQVASLPGGFDYREFLAAQGIHARFWIRGSQVETLEPVHLSLWGKFQGAALRLRSRTLQLIRETLQPDFAALLGAMLLGDRSGMSPAMTQALVASGLMHVTAISGLHVTFVMGFLFVVLKALGLRRKQAAYLIFPVMGFFLVMVGFRLPTLRAVLMGWALIMTFVCERDVDSLSSVSAAGLLILLISPLSLFQAGFQMSFVTVAALVLLVPRWDSWVLANQIPGRWLWTALGVSTIAQAGVAPILAYHYGIWAPVGILANILALPLVWVLLVVGLGFVASAMLGGVGTIVLGPVAWLFLAALEGIVWLWAWLPAGHFYAPRLSAIQLGIWYAALLLIASGSLTIIWKGRKKKVRKAYLFLSLAVCWLWIGILQPERSDLEIEFLSLGQGDCIYLEFPGGGNMLVDGGPRYDAGGRAPELVRYLLRRGVKRIDAVVNTHPQADHIGNLPEVLQYLDVGCVYHCGMEGQGEACEAFQKAIEQEEGCVCRAVQRGQRIEGFPGVVLEVLGPNSDYRAYEGLDINCHSVVLRVKYGEFSCLLTGDISEEIEQDLLQSRLLDDCDVLKVAHHGSHTSSCPTFLERVRPEIAVIEVGRNRFGHPAPAVLKRLEAVGSTVLRTDENGTVRVISDGRGYRVMTMQ